MSVRVWTKIWDTCLYQGGDLLVLLAMADIGDDHGNKIFPGIDLLAAKCRMTVRGTQNALRKLEEDKVIERVTKTTGRGHLSEYFIDVERIQALQAEHESEKPDCPHCKARNARPKRANYVHPLPKGENRIGKGENGDGERAKIATGKGENGDGAYIDNRPEPSLEPSNNRDAAASPQADLLGATHPAPKKKTVKEPQPLPDWIPPEAWAGFVEMRQKIKRPLTARAAGMIVTELDRLRKLGHDPGAVLDQSTLKCWQDVYELKEAGNGNGNHNNGRTGFGAAARGLAAATEDYENDTRRRRA